ncbi:hypothetical protein N7532_011096 [Penicillium argentinense]|uniref:Uncharacterized protein n=1 Tax=Penicillium argentinense TaxID=1131581 RepID=A0A9W9EHT6_9EURO|nr:uncharacterized protein N7532_011096 [Penicillium argentinense]KAJ5082053.1 hypothetical protein N7532_011096 [Penicillium argentinense]
MEELSLFHSRRESATAPGLPLFFSLSRLPQIPKSQLLIMVELISPPDPRALLPPLLACLPTAFVSPRPPPALLPLLSPILRQRIQVLTSLSTSPDESWLRLLCWDAAKAERLQSIVDGATFEPHPVSGEIELTDDLPVTYKRIDDETLRALVTLPEYSLAVIYLWCPTDENGRGWRVAELLPREGPTDDEKTWASSIGEADSQEKERLLAEVLEEKEEKNNSQNDPAKDDEDDDDDDDDYWAQYDATPGQTPKVKTPAPGASSTHGPSGLSEASYFNQYGNLQPAMDNHDPAEEQPEVGPSSLNGDTLANLLRRQEAAFALNHPRPASTSSSSSDAIAKLEQHAESQSTYEVGVKQHISTSVKSLFRLAKATGMSRADFQSLVQTEVELLNVTDDDITTFYAILTTTKLSSLTRVAKHYKYKNENEITALDAGGVSDESDGVLEAGFSENTSGTDTQVTVLFQRELSAKDPWHGDADTDDYLNNIEISFSGTTGTFDFSERAAGVLGLGRRLVVDFDIPENDLCLFRDMLRRVVTWGVPSQVPKLEGVLVGFQVEIVWF